MSVRIEQETAWLEGGCGVADAEPLYAALSEGRATSVDISAAHEIHAAVAQTLLKFPVRITGEATDTFVRDFVMPALLRRRPSNPGRGAAT
jgi:hypothetical protein